MFITILLAKFRNSEFIQFVKNALEIISSKDPEILKVKAQFDPANAVFLKLYNIFKKGRGSDITEELRELDERRDNAYYGITKILDGYTHHCDEDMRDHARLLIESIELYGSSLARLNYQSETSTLESLVKTWERDPRMAEAIEKLNLSAWVTEMKEANTLFNKRFMDRVREQAHNPNETVASLREETKDQVTILLKHLEAYATVSEDPVYDAVIKEINTLAEAYNQTVQDRLTSGNGEESAEEPATGKESSIDN